MVLQERKGGKIVKVKRRRYRREGDTAGERDILRRKK